jgi:hypothetical protein
MHILAGQSPTIWLNCCERMKNWIILLPCLTMWVLVPVQVPFSWLRVDGSNASWRNERKHKTNTRKLRKSLSQILQPVQWKRETLSASSLSTFRPAVQLTSQQANRPKTKSTQIIAYAGKCRSLWKQSLHLHKIHDHVRKFLLENEQT